MSVGHTSVFFLFSVCSFVAPSVRGEAGDVAKKVCFFLLSPPLLRYSSFIPCCFRRESSVDPNLSSKSSVGQMQDFEARPEREHHRKRGLD